MTEINSHSERIKSERLNQHCTCVKLDWSAMDHNLSIQLDDHVDEIPSSSAIKQFFSNTAIFMPSSDLEQMLAIVRAIVATAVFPDYQRQVFS
ncbi:MAG TPA: hypothetical protein VK999_05325 [Methylotenera sp.]|nr:hypothetical protein [Methylotenera sp.]